MACASLASCFLLVGSHGVDPGIAGKPQVEAVCPVALGPVVELGEHHGSSPGACVPPLLEPFVGGTQEPE